MYTSFSGFNKESFSPIVENFSIEDAKNTVYDKFDAINKQFSDQYQDISNNLLQYEKNRGELSSNNKKYRYDDTPDSISLLSKQPKGKDIYTVVNSDINELKLYQNSIYVTGVIACATLLIAAIFVGRK